MEEEEEFQRLRASKTRIVLCALCRHEVIALPQCSVLVEQGPWLRKKAAAQRTLLGYQSSSFVRTERR